MAYNTYNANQVAINAGNEAFAKSFIAYSKVWGTAKLENKTAYRKEFSHANVLAESARIAKEAALLLKNYDSAGFEAARETFYLSVARFL